MTTEAKTPTPTSTRLPDSKSSGRSSSSFRYFFRSSMGTKLDSFFNLDRTGDRGISDDADSLERELQHLQDSQQELYNELDAVDGLPESQEKQHSDDNTSQSEPSVRKAVSGETELPKRRGTSFSLKQQVSEESYRNLLSELDNEFHPLDSIESPNTTDTFKDQAAAINPAKDASKPMFQYKLPPHRLGRAHDSLESFKSACPLVKKQKEYSLVVVTEPATRRILLGKKHRGFGKGFYNSFGGKRLPREDMVTCAVRELQEETGIVVSTSVMEQSKVGVLRFTLQQDDMAMVVHLFRVNVSCHDETSNTTVIAIDPNTIRACDEITPEWFDNWFDIPLHQMFADDSIWLTRLLSSGEQGLALDGYFHFEAGGQDVNTIRDYYLHCNVQKKAPVLEQPKYSLEQQLFHALHSSKINTPSIKEFKESLAFCNVVKTFLGKKSVDVVIDVAGGHGALGALFLILSSAKTAIVLDPAKVGKGRVKRAWGHLFPNKSLRYRHECLRTGLADELSRHLETTDKSRIVVVGCHACQHLSNEILDISTTSGVHVAVMPCCQKDTSPGSTWKATSKRLEIPFGTTMDVLLAGKVMSWNTGIAANVSYDVRLKTIDEKITPQNRIILCRAIENNNNNSSSLEIERAHERLQKAYSKAHGKTRRTRNKQKDRKPQLCLQSAALGFTSCLILMLLIQKR